jgi:hypothetical protein
MARVPHMAAAVEKTAALRQPFFYFFSCVIQIWGAGKNYNKKKLKKKSQKN